MERGVSPNVELLESRFFGHDLGLNVGHVVLNVGHVHREGFFGHEPALATHNSAEHGFDWFKWLCLFKIFKYFLIGVFFS